MTDGIYSILNSDELAKRNGELRHEDLTQTLDVDRYPRAMHNFLLDLMRKFELCFEFTDQENHFLVPELLPEDQPPEADEFPPETCLNFEYRYPVIPEGMVPRFIVRTYILSTGEARWRTGVILRFEGNRALVSADLQERRIRVAVDGPSQSRRRLLAVIRTHFEAIHSSFKFVPEEYVVPAEHPEVVVPYSNLIAWENDGLKDYLVPIGGRPVALSVPDLLNGVDLEGSRGPRKASSSVRVFISYSHRDEEFRKELDVHLSLLKRQNWIRAWDDRQVEAGTDWAKEIDDNLSNADLTLFLVSPDFLASDYCYELEAETALERHKAGATRAIPIVIRHCEWTESPLGKLQALPSDGRPIKAFEDRDEAWKNVVETLRKVATEVGKDTIGPRFKHP